MPSTRWNVPDGTDGGETITEYTEIEMFTGLHRKRQGLLILADFFKARILSKQSHAMNLMKTDKWKNLMILRRILEMLVVIAAGC